MPSPPPALHVLISTLKGSAPRFITTVLGDPAPHSLSFDLTTSRYHPVPRRPDPASAQLTRAVKAGGDGIQKGVLRGQQPLHDRHGPGFGFEVLRGLPSARPGRRGRATGGAGAPHAPACLLPSSRLCALNLLVLSSAPQHFGSRHPHPTPPPHGSGSSRRARPAPTTWLRTGRGRQRRPQPSSVALLPEGSGPRVSLGERLGDTPTIQA